MPAFFLGFILFISGFLAGYAARAYLSRRRRTPPRRKRFEVHPARF